MLNQHPQLNKPNLVPAPPRVPPSSRCSNRPPCWKRIALQCIIIWNKLACKKKYFLDEGIEFFSRGKVFCHRYLLTRIDVLLQIFAKPNTLKPNICSPGLVSCSSQCFQPNLQLSTFSTQSGQASCLPPSSGWRSPPENINIEIHRMKGYVMIRAHFRKVVVITYCIFTSLS